VSLQPAVRTHDPQFFSLLDRKDFSPVGYKRYNKNSGREVAWDEVVRGFEYEPDEYVVLSDEELRRANVEASESIEILEFVERRKSIPSITRLPITSSRSRGVARATRCSEPRWSGAARSESRASCSGRASDGALLVREQVLVLDLLRYAHELRGLDEVQVPPKSAKGAGVSESEIKMARQLIDGMRGKWDPEKFKDEIPRRRDGARAPQGEGGPDAHDRRARALRDARRARTEVMDLMPLLKRSLAERGGQGRRPARAKGGRTAPTTRRTRRSA